MTKEIIMFPVDGLSIDDNGFNWNDRFMLTNGKRKSPGIALAAVLTDKRDDAGEMIEEAHHILTIFLSCYQLVNTSNPFSLAGYDNHELEPNESFSDFVKQHVMPFDYQSYTPNYPEEQTMRQILSAVPTFEKVMAAVDSGKVPALETALVMYYRSVNTMESIEDFIGVVTALEALFSDGTSELTYKVALRTAIMIHDKMNNSREVFEEVKKIYDKRSKLVHGSLVPIRFRKELIPLKMGAERYAHYSLLNYIDLVSKGMDKAAIIKMLDDKALGVNKL